MSAARSCARAVGGGCAALSSARPYVRTTRHACEAPGRARLHVGVESWACVALAQHVHTGAHTDGLGSWILANSYGDDDGGAHPVTIHGGNIKKERENFLLYIYLFIYFSKRTRLTQLFFRTIFICHVIITCHIG